MNIATRRHYPALFLSSLILLHGCTGSPITDTKEHNQAAASKVIAEERTHPEERVFLPAPLTVSQDAIFSRQAQESALAPQKAKALPGTRPTAMPVYGNTIVAESIAPHALQFQRESYNAVTENSFIATANDPLSTFSIDVDTASYANIRRWLTGGALPPVGAVRIEEMINYFSYAYPQPETGPIGITTELGPCPWQPANKLVRIGIKAKDLDPGNIPASNLVFLIDVSGSMNQANKLPLLQQSMLLLTGELTGQDRVSIVVYAGTDRVILPPTAGDQKETIRKAITSLSSGGSTHASSGIQTAYRLARQCFIKNGNNRIILASDGDFNVGVTSRDELERIVSKERQAGVFLTVLGFGMGNYHDDTMEILADRGNGNYSYIDSLLEAKKVLIKERTGTLFTLARDVKLQIEFNPARVAGYRLIGYENRALADEDFNNDNKDAGEIGAGHTVTALYELLPIGSPGVPDVDPLKYQQLSRPVDNSNEILTVKVRYKPAHSDKSLLLATAVSDNDTAFGATSADFRFAATVAGFGMLLRHSDQISGLNYPKLLTMAQNSRGTDEQGYRAEFIHLLEMSELLQDK
ncbi:VWA domain-containing protein [Desulfopila sp. IMCC35006]|uniref:vWA domain-containing protein n=1 Tax=Desulfopila sp. IMCC35006 TaxID=2569542 RepID=UPI001F0EEAEE|nr:VWA domain-containing protein [Desulfopila sp. IMCC35006]